MNNRDAAIAVSHRVDSSSFMCRTPGDRGRAATVRIVADLHPASPIPMYHQLAEQILRGIYDGCYPLGSQLEPEPRIAQHLGISRHTVRQAMDVLHRHHVIARKKGFPHTVICAASSTSGDAFAAPAAAQRPHHAVPVNERKADDVRVNQDTGIWRPLDIYVPNRMTEDEASLYVYAVVRHIAWEAGEFVAAMGEIGTAESTTPQWRKYSTSYRPGPPSTFPEPSLKSGTPQCPR